MARSSTTAGRRTRHRWRRLWPAKGSPLDLVLGSCLREDASASASVVRAAAADDLRAPRLRVGTRSLTPRKAVVIASSASATSLPERDCRDCGSEAGYSASGQATLAITPSPSSGLGPPTA